MTGTYKWGIAGPGRIAHKFAEGLKALPNAELYAVASRSSGRAEAFAGQHGFRKTFASYREMSADSELDVVYIATTNNLHFEHAMLFLEAGKAVLCEKPFASSRSQVEQMIAKAREKKVFLMEALCTRFMPSLRGVSEQIDRGTPGKVSMLQCDFGFILPFDPENRVYNPLLGGGSIPDIGIYPVFMALYLFGYPVEIKVVSVPAPTGTDRTTAVLFKHRGGEISMLSSSFDVLLENEARIYGEKGCLKLHRLFSKTDRLSFIDSSSRETDIPVAMDGNGYNYEAAEVMDCLDGGRTESRLMPLSLSLDLIAALDEIARLAKDDFPVS
jgi:predicted dehydrogenase